jgi:hypothetical protein
MASHPFKLPAQWEDWCDWALGIWLLLSPWILRFEADSAATFVTVLAGIFVIRTELVTLMFFKLWEEWANVALGAGIAASPWLLEFEATVPSANLAIVGALILGLGVYEVRSGRRAAAGGLFKRSADKPEW